MEVQVEINFNCIEASTALTKITLFLRLKTICTYCERSGPVKRVVALYGRHK